MTRKAKTADKPSWQYDAIVLGAGPAGEGAAMKLAKSGRKVAVVDQRLQVGGNCAHVGTIPARPCVKRYITLPVISVTLCSRRLASGNRFHCPRY